MHQVRGRRFQGGPLAITAGIFEGWLQVKFQKWNVIFKQKSCHVYACAAKLAVPRHRLLASFGNPVAARGSTLRYVLRSASQGS